MKYRKVRMVGLTIGKYMHSRMVTICVNKFRFGGKQNFSGVVEQLAAIDRNFAEFPEPESKKVKMWKIRG